MTATDHAGTAGPPTQVRPELSVRAWLTQTTILAGRQLIVWVRDVSTLLQSLIFPALSMIMFKVVLGDAVGKATGENSAFGTVPMVVLVGAMFGSLAAATRLNQERGTGLLSRLYVLPINRAADLSSRIIAELTRILATTLILLAAGHLIGFRFTHGPLAALGIVAVAMLYGVAFSVLVLAIAVSAKPGAALVPMLSLVSSLLMFFNSGFAPADSYPTWLQFVVRNQPMSPAIEVMRSLAAPSGGEAIWPNLLKVLIWSVVIVAVATYPALRGYRRAATSH